MLVIHRRLHCSVTYKFNIQHMHFSLGISLFVCDFIFGQLTWAEQHTVLLRRQHENQIVLSENFKQMTVMEF